MLPSRNDLSNEFDVILINKLKFPHLLISMEVNITLPVVNDLKLGISSF